MQAGWQDPVKWDDKKEVSRTSNGLWLLSLGVIVASVPLFGLGLLGDILALVGVVLTILGREAFGERHGRYVLASLVIYIVGFVIIAIFSAIFVSNIASAATNTSGANAVKDSLSSSFNEFLIGIFIGGAISGLGQVLFTYAIQNRRGRVFLWTGYALTLLVGVIAFLIIGPQVSSALQQAFSGGSYNAGPIQALASQLDYVRLLNIIPAIMFALGYYSVVVRIKIGQRSGS